MIIVCGTSYMSERDTTVPTLVGRRAGFAVPA